jgi:transcriptional regulator with XRE-family HTH domain
MTSAFKAARRFETRLENCFIGDVKDIVPSGLELGQRLAKLRQEQGLTEEEVAQRAAVTTREVKTFETQGDATASTLISLIGSMSSDLSLSRAFLVPRFTKIEDVTKHARRTKR